MMVAALLLAVVAVVAFRPFEDQSTEELAVESAVVVEELLVNGQSGRVVLSTDDQSVITAVLRNDGDEPEEVELSVRLDERLFDDRHDWTYTVEPGEEKELEEVREVHHTWYQGEFTVELGDKIVEVAVE